MAFGILDVEHYYDAKVNSITIAPSSPRSGNTVTITNNIVNQGSADLTDIEVTSVVTGPGNYIQSFSKTANAGNVSFSWDTIGVPSGDYAISTSISHPKDMDSSSNTLSKQIFLLLPLSLCATTSTDKTEYEVGETATINATIRVCETEEEVADASVKAEITKPDDSKETIVLNYSSGKYSATFTPGQIGTYEVTVTASKEGYKDGSDSLTFTVVQAVDSIPPETFMISGPSGTIDYRDALFSWTASDDVTLSSSLQYSYYLEGYDDGWSSWTWVMTRQYTDLPNGSYTLG